MTASFTATVDPTRPIYYDESDPVREEGGEELLVQFAQADLRA